MKTRFIYLTVIVCILFASCIEEEAIQPNTKQGNFEALWKIIDTKYCYLDYKKINWDSIRTVYNGRLNTVNTQYTLFDLLGSMLNELKDGHVNLYSDFDRSRYWKWFTDYPDNFYLDIIHSDRYIGENYKIAGGMQYGLLDNGNIGYIYYGSFMNYFSDANMAYIFRYFSNCKGIVLDVRNNGGGSLDYSKELASYFFDKETTTGYLLHKTGNGHSDFSSPVEISTPSNQNVQWSKPVIILTNRMSYSATNDFVNRMKQAPKAIILGDKTGGGGGLPLSSELPNGWLIRFSACPMLNCNHENTEWGIDPDVTDSIKVADKERNIDTIIEHAIKIIKG